MSFAVFEILSRNGQAFEIYETAEPWIVVAFAITKFLKTALLDSTVMCSTKNRDILKILKIRLKSAMLWL